MCICSSSLWAPRRCNRLRTSTSSPTMFMMSSRRLVSTRTEVSATGALASRAGIAGAALVLPFSAGTFSGLPAGWAGLSALTLAGVAAGCLASGAGADLAVSAVGLPPLPCRSSSNFSNSSSEIRSSPPLLSLVSSLVTLSPEASWLSGAALPVSGGPENWPLPCNWSSRASNSSSEMSSPLPPSPPEDSLPSPLETGALVFSSSRASSNRSNSSSVISPPSSPELASLLSFCSSRATAALAGADSPADCASASRAAISSSGAGVGSSW